MPSPGMGTASTIACQMKKFMPFGYGLLYAYFLVVSTTTGAIVVESPAITTVVSGVTGAGVTLVRESPDVVVVVVLLSSQEAKKAPIAKTRNSFFILSGFNFKNIIVYTLPHKR